MVVFTVDFKLENFVTEQQVDQITSLTMDFLAVNLQRVTVPAMQSVIASPDGPVETVNPS